MPQFRMTLKRVIYAEVIVEADSITDARNQVGADPHEWFVMSNTIGLDTTTISAVKREDRLHQKAGTAPIHK